MKAEELRGLTERAEREKKIGLFFWVNKDAWSRYSVEIRPGEESYAKALEMIFKGKEYEVVFHWVDLDLPVFLAVPVKQLQSSEEFFTKILGECCRYTGPVEFVPKQ